jgi:site-specific DNA-methyltransferase (adenine-specific)
MSNRLLGELELNRIYQRDCIEGMRMIPDKSIDLIATDPPYEISRKTNFHKGNAKRKRHDYDFGEWDKADDDLIENAIREGYRVLRNGGVMYTFFDAHKINRITELYKEVGFKQIKVLPWIKTNPVPANCKVTYVNAVEFFVYGVKKGSATFNVDRIHLGVFETPICQGKERTAHKTQKPLRLFNELISISSNEGDVVLDPFMGSGTTAVAAAQLNRRYIGFEREPEYVQIANQRLESLDDAKAERKLTEGGD